MLASAVLQSELVTQTRVSTLSKILFPYRSSQSNEESFLCYTVNLNFPINPSFLFPLANYLFPTTVTLLFCGKKKSENESLSHFHFFTTSWTIESMEFSLGQNTGVGSLSLLQGIFSTQGLNPGLPCCRQILYQLSHKGSPLCSVNRSICTFF